ncbi:Predicted transport protein [Actinacidiphila paucisporea]|uniref:Predicted transport protein n=2 Tax=Actinacidiphila paucisporea TaxID=310782 RepID=A0A1M7PY79_9ACTN|nr:Predicted transport protein [Actinacidiphila paucisporea]
MEVMLGVRFLASEYPTGRWHRGRIDTLGLDENNTPVVIEFKKGSDSGVLPQAVSYLTWLHSARFEFEALVKERLGSEAVESIDWRNPRAICIAAGFSHHDRVAVLDSPRPIDLVRYRVFDGGLLSLLLVESGAGSATSVPPQPRRRRTPLGSGNEGELALPQATTGPAPACLRDLYGELDEALTAWGEVEVRMLRHYVAYRLMVNRASVIFRPSHGVILTYLSLDPDTVVLEEGFSRDMRGIGHLGTGDLEVRIASAADLEKAGPLIRRAFEAA